MNRTVWKVNKFFYRAGTDEGESVIKAIEKIPYRLIALTLTSTARYVLERYYIAPSHFYEEAASRLSSN